MGGLTTDGLQQTQRGRPGVRSRGVKVIEDDVKLFENFMVGQARCLQVIVG